MEREGTKREEAEAVTPAALRVSAFNRLLLSSSFPFFSSFLLHPQHSSPHTTTSLTCLSKSVSMGTFLPPFSLSLFVLYACSLLILLPLHRVSFPFRFCYTPRATVFPAFPPSRDRVLMHPMVALSGSH